MTFSIIYKWLKKVEKLRRTYALFETYLIEKKVHYAFIASKIH